MRAPDRASPLRTSRRKPRADEIDVHGLTHPGRIRRENQDHFLVCELQKRMEVHVSSLPAGADLPLHTERLAYLAMVADGVGGRAGGAEASRRTLEAVTRYVAEGIHTYYTSNPTDDDAFSRALEESAVRCHADLVGDVGAGSDGKVMATTLTLFIGVWPHAYLLQVGDSRYYLLRSGELEQISRDQTIAQDLVDQGIFSRTEARDVRWANVLSSAIGGSRTAPVVTCIDNDWGLVHLLCSDGLTRHVPDERIAERLRTMTSARQVCEALLQDALDDGGTDNITLIVGRTQRRDEGTSSPA